MDIALLFSDDYGFDIGFENADLTEEEGLETSVLLSIFTDRRADIGDNIDDLNDKRGWWGDLTLPGNDKIGSKMWLLDRSKLTRETATLAEGYLFQCLKWMIEDNVAAKIVVSAEIKATGHTKDTIAATINIYKKDGTVKTFAFNDLWQAQIRKL